MKAKQEDRSITAAWQQYEDGRDYNRRTGLYGRVRENERFYRGEQWQGVDSGGLPTPVFNVIKRIIDYIIGTVLSSRIELSLYDEGADYMPEGPKKLRRGEAVAMLERHIHYLWERNHMDSLFREGALDAAISGDAVFYVYWDEGAATGQLYNGEIKCELTDSTRLFVADCSSCDLQRQEYIILSGRAPVAALIREAAAGGASREELELITPDAADYDSSDFEMLEPGGYGAGKATYLIKFSRDEEGFVVWEKTVKNTVIKRRRTSMTRYPVAYFSWERVKGSYHGSSPVTSLIQNQKYINKAFALMMKHMIDTAFSKVIYDKKLIPEWTNEVGEAIGVVSGGDVGNAVKVIGAGEMQDYYLDVIERTVSLTKELSGATEVALGESDPSNTSAIMALRAVSELPFDTLRTAIYACAGQIVEIWCEMVLEYYPEGRRLRSGESAPDYGELGGALLRAVAKAGAGERISQMYQLSTLNRLLDSGSISAAQYLSRLPEGLVPDRQALLAGLSAAKGGDENGN